jgi:hypothetical protein
MLGRTGAATTSIASAPIRWRVVPSGNIACCNNCLIVIETFPRSDGSPNSPNSRRDLASRAAASSGECISTSVPKSPGLIFLMARVRSSGSFAILKPPFSSNSSFGLASRMRSAARMISSRLSWSFCSPAFIAARILGFLRSSLAAA